MNTKKILLFIQTWSDKEKDWSLKEHFDYALFSLILKDVVFPLYIFQMISPKSCKSKLDII